MADPGDTDPERPRQHRRRPEARRRPPRPGGRRRRRGIGALATAAVIVAVLLLAEAVAAAVGPNIPRRSGSEERAYIKADQMFDRSGPTAVAFLGSSETAGGIVPSVVAANAPALDGGVYNAALAGTFLPTYRDWADDVVVPALHPKVVVLGMLPMTVADIPVGQIKGYQEARAAYLSAFRQITGGDLGELGWRLRQHSALIRYRPYLRQPHLLYEGVRNTLSGDTPQGRPAGSNMDWSKETNPATVKANTGPDGEVYDYHQQSIPIDADPLGAAIYREFAKGTVDTAELAGLVTHLRRQGITPVVVFLPVDRDPLAKGGADLAVLDGWTRVVQDWADGAKVPVLDEFTQHWDSNLFHDRNHLDAAGAQKLSEVVGRWLQQRCDDHQLGDACRTT